MKICTITFHASHNYGSVLQAYAMQNFIKRICLESGIECEYHILNYRTELQKRLYAVFPRPASLKQAVKLFLRIPYYIEYKRKNASFEEFIIDHLFTTTEVNSITQLKDIAQNFDIYFAGSDQIWNVRAHDAADAYFLPFVQGVKVSYAASFGPLKINWKKFDKDRYSRYLQEFSAISVREEGSAENVEFLTGDKPLIHIDPTLLITKDEWLRVSSGVSYNQGNYIFLYCLEPTKIQLSMAKLISDILQLPIVISRYNNRYDYFNSFKKLYSTGPKDFISLINNAKLILTTSFHGTVFSILFEKPFFVIDSDNDYRIQNLLKLTDLLKRNINNTDYISKLKIVWDIDFSGAKHAIERERKRSSEYLMEIINGYKSY